MLRTLFDHLIKGVLHVERLHCPGEVEQCELSCKNSILMCGHPCRNDMLVFRYSNGLYRFSFYVCNGFFCALLELESILTIPSLDYLLLVPQEETAKMNSIVIY